MFTLSCVNAVLNALVIGIFMPDEVIVLYNLLGAAVAYGSKWFYLIYVAVPVIISGALLLSEKITKKSSDDSSAGGDKSDDEVTTNALDEILNGNTPHKDNIGMIAIWFFAIISWVMTGIALNNIENVSIILPSIIVIMLSAAAIFLTSLQGSSPASDSVVGVRLKWLKDNSENCKRANKFSLYTGLFSGMIGVCLAAWSIFVSNNIPNCIAVAQLAAVAFILPIVYSYLICRKK